MYQQNTFFFKDGHFFFLIRLFKNILKMVYLVKHPRIFDEVISSLYNLSSPSFVTKSFQHYNSHFLHGGGIWRLSSTTYSHTQNQHLSLLTFFFNSWSMLSFSFLTGVPRVLCLSFWSFIIFLLETLWPQFCWQFLPVKVSPVHCTESDFFLFLIFGKCRN